VSLIKPRATLGQRQFLIKSRTQINIHQFTGKATPTQYKDKQDATHPGGGLTPRIDWAAGLFPDSFPDVRIRRTRMPVGRTSPSTRLGATIARPADVPLGDGDSDRDVAQPRSGCLSSRTTDYSVDTSPMQADGPGSGLVPRTDRQSLLLLLTTATSSSADVPWLPVSSGGPTQHPAFYSNSELEPQFPADSGGSTHDAKLHFANQSHSDLALSLPAHTVESYLNSAFLSFSQLHFSHSYRTLQNTCVL